MSRIPTLPFFTHSFPGTWPVWMTHKLCRVPAFINWGELARPHEINSYESKVRVCSSSHSLISLWHQNSLSCIPEPKTQYLSSPLFVCILVTQSFLYFGPGGPLEIPKDSVETSVAFPTPRLMVSSSYIRNLQWRFLRVKFSAVAIRKTSLLLYYMIQNG